MLRGKLTKPSPLTPVRIQPGLTPPDCPRCRTYCWAGGELAAKAEKVEPDSSSDTHCWHRRARHNNLRSQSLHYMNRVSDSGRRWCWPEWIVAPRSPLASRVMVIACDNTIYGCDGIIRTPSDVGRMETASIQSCWMAGSQFIEKKWKHSRPLQLDLTSNTYQHGRSPEANDTPKSIQ